MTRDGDTATRLRAQVEAVQPGLISPHATIRLTRGQFNDVLIVDDAFVFRFPRSVAAAELLQAEVDLLRALHGRLPLPIPNPEIVHLGSDERGGGFSGYRLLPGGPLARDIVARNSHPEIARIAGQIAEFLRELHAIPARDLPPLQTADTPSDWAKLFAAFEAELFPFMRPDVRTDVTRSFSYFLASPAGADFSPVLRHGDLGGDNIRYDAVSNRITGIIDFSSAALGDPAVDLAGLSWYGQPFLEALSDRYPMLADPRLRSRAAFYRSTFALQQALWAIRAGDEEEFEDGIRAYR